MDRQSWSQAAAVALGKAATVKFVRHLAAATLVVAVVVVLGLVWNHFAASTLIGNLQGHYKREVVLGRQAVGPPPSAAALAHGTIQTARTGLRSSASG
jgi:hypothetical protein